ncbi:MFS transporter [Chromobacterium haemolyticum]|uniref:MFS transporter n=2 Tax=Chromobacterium haemolyticum TaxID=394935 RepID=UPI001747B7A1|nr:MFS transporter [Chromobacterium haemolyticum]QOD81130.1 MFS transporter [Chromobacterium haemolyticum]
MPVSPSSSSSSAAALAGLALAILLASLGGSVANVGLPALAAAFRISFQQAQWVVLAYLLLITLASVNAGRLGDQLGRRRALLAGIALFCVASVGCGAATAFWALIAGRALQGVGAALMLALGMAFVADIAPREQVGRAMGLLGAVSAVGTALGPSLGGALIAAFGWRAMFWLMLPLGALAFALAWRALPAERGPVVERAGFDAAGSGWLALTLAAYALAVTLKLDHSHGHFGALNAVLLLAAAVGCAAFVRTESRAAAPMLNLALLRDPALAAGLFCNALVSTVLMATLVVGPFHLARGLGLDAAGVGLAMSAGPLVAALSGVPAGRLVDRHGAETMARAGLAGIGAGALALALLPSSLGLAGYLLPLALITAAYALFQAANNTQALTGAAARQRGLVSGLLNLSRNLGLISGASLMGAVFAAASGAADIAVAAPPQVAAGTRVAFGLAAALMLAALLASARARGKAVPC